jgi:FAD-dependent oxidoreductase family protein/molybdopterin-dependent oxidoreductase-like protein protein
VAVLTADVTPRLDTDTWTFTVEGLVDRPTTWTWDEIHALPGSVYSGDIHCVTTWSKRDVTFGGVSVDTLLDIAPDRFRPPATCWPSATPATPRTFPWPTLRAARRGSPGTPTAVRSRLSTAAPPGCSSRTSTSGKAPNGWRDCACSTTTSPASGNATATTTMAIPGSSSATTVTGPAGPMPWQTARVVAIRPETARAKTLRLALPGPSLHRAGQHYVVRLTALDGYTASRSYSVASAPDRSPEYELTVERLERGEVSTFLHDVVEAGDELEVQGPIGKWFVWEGGIPAILVGGGSGVVPLMSMLRQARATPRSPLVRMVTSVRRPGDLCYADELAPRRPSSTPVRRPPPPRLPTTPVRSVRLVRGRTGG